MSEDYWTLWNRIQSDIAKREEENQRIHESNRAWIHGILQECNPCRFCNTPPTAFGWGVDELDIYCPQHWAQTKINSREYGNEFRAIRAWNQANP